jgi:hypothetical protein
MSQLFRAITKAAATIATSIRISRSLRRLGGQPQLSNRTGPPRDERHQKGQSFGPRYLTTICTQDYAPIAKVCKARDGQAVPIDTTQLPIGKALKVERVIAGVSTTLIAAAVGISVGHLSRIEKGERTASPALVTAIRSAIASAEASA